MELQNIDTVLGIAGGICIIIGTLIKVLEYIERHK